MLGLPVSLRSRWKQIGCLVNEADTCRKYVVPALQAAGWEDSPHSIHEQATVTDGRIVPVGDGFVRRGPKKVDYLLRYRKDFPLAVVEAKADYKKPGDGLQQAKDYAELLGLKFAYSTNGEEIVEFDFFQGTEALVDGYPTPEALWSRYRAGVGIEDDLSSYRLLEPFSLGPGLEARYYQRIAVNSVVEAVLKGQKRALLTMATGTGKSLVAFQICWKLWNSKWNRVGANRRPRILYLADLNILIDQPKDGVFASFGDARYQIESGEVVRSREIYFALYQALAEDERREGLFRSYPKDFFDLVIVDECHRGSARSESSWRVILEHFSDAFQLGMTATPVRGEAADTYQYFGEPVYEYSLRQGIDDGYLAPYRVHRVVTEWDAAGWRPSKGELDRYGREIPDELYSTKDFERAVALKARTETIAAHLSKFLRSTDRHHKTIVFCVDQDHALEMRRALVNQNSDVVADYPDYVCRVTSDEGDIGRGHLSRFQDLDTLSPTILTTSKLLTTGVDAPTTKNVVLARVVNSMTEFKQIIGRGTRVRHDYDKLWFNIIDYTGSATRLFADPEFDGYPTLTIETTIEDDGTEVETTVIDDRQEEPIPTPGEVIEAPMQTRSKYYVDSGTVEIAADLVYELDANGTQLRVVRYSEYAGDTVRSLYPTPHELAESWADPSQRQAVIQTLAERGIGFDQLAEEAGMPEADPFDLLCHVAYNAPLRSRRERLRNFRSDQTEFFERYGPTARQVLEILLEKYARFGDSEFTLPDVLKIPPLSDLGNATEITDWFGGPGQLRQAVMDLQVLLYADQR